MPSISNLVSTTVVIQATLACGAAAMSWRGASLSGDTKKIHHILWGVASAATFILTMIVGVVGNYQSNAALISANKRADDSNNKLSLIQGALSDLKAENNQLAKAMQNIAGKANVDPNQSAQALASQITDKLSGIQQQLQQSKQRIEKLESPPHDPDELYQNDRPVAKVVRTWLASDQKSLVFIKIFDALELDTSKPVEFRSLVLNCAPAHVETLIQSFQGKIINNVIDDIPCSVVSGTMDVPKDSLTAPRPALTPQEPPAGK